MDFKAPKFVIFPQIFTELSRKSDMIRCKNWSISRRAVDLNAMLR